MLTITQVTEINDAATLIAFGVWALVVLGTCKAVFRSFPALELTSRLEQRWRRDAEEMRRLHWELKHGARYSTELAQGNPHVAPTRLTDDERAARRRRLQGLRRPTLPYRMLHYFTSCGFCQAFWVALAASLLTGVSLPVALCSAVAYGYVCSILDQRLGGAKPGCKDGKCG